MVAPCFNLISLSHFINKRLHSSFQSSGLQSTITEVHPGTSVHSWIPRDDPNHSFPHKPALLLIHGFGTNAMWQWNSQIRPLQTRFRLYLPDLIFFGKSTTSTPHRSEVFQAEMMMKLMESLGVTRFSVAGTSYGGFVAFWMAHLFPNVVEKVVIANSGVCMIPEDNADLLKRAKMEAISDLLLPQTPAALKTLMRLSICKPPKFLPSWLLQDVVNYFYMENRDERVQLLNDLVVGSGDGKPLPRLTQKVLIIWGDHDGIFPPELANRLKEFLGDKTQLVVMNKCGHCVQMEEPQQFNKRVEMFLVEEGG